MERIHGVHQDRLIKKLRRKKIVSYEAANEYLEKQYLPEHNRRFAREVAKVEDYHGRKPSGREMRQIFRLETQTASVRRAREYVQTLSRGAAGRVW